MSSRTTDHGPKILGDNVARLTEKAMGMASREIFARNLQHMQALYATGDEKKEPDAATAKRAGVDQKSVWFAANPTEHRRTLTLRILESIAEKGFGIPLWLFFLPWPEGRELDLSDLRSVVDGYLFSSDEGRKEIRRTVEREVRYTRAGIKGPKPV